MAKIQNLSYLPLRFILKISFAFTVRTVFCYNIGYFDNYTYFCTEISVVMKSKNTSYTLKQKNILAGLGENLKLARLRRKLSTRSLAERAGIAVSTLVNIEKGSPSVSLGYYLQVLTILRLEKDILLIADQDPIGRQIQDAGLIVKKRAPKAKKTPSPIEYMLDRGLSEDPEFE